MQSDIFNFEIRMERLTFFIFSCVLILVSIMELSSAIDMITPGESIRDGETLISSLQKFELGFFSRGNSNNRYLGIWYKVSPEEVLWVANRNKSIVGTSGVLTIFKNGSLLLFNQDKSIIWSFNSSVMLGNPAAQLLDSGNFVVRDSSDSSPKNYLWQSFDYPSDTLLAGMMLGRNLKTGFERYLTSWRSPDDPSPTDFSLRLENNELPQLVIRTTTKEVARSGPWNGIQFNGIPIMQNRIFKPKLVQTNDELSYTFDAFNDTVLTLVKVNQSANALQRLVWDESRKDWNTLYSWPFDMCGYYAVCRVNGNCRIGKTPICGCLKGFELKSQDEWGTPQTTKCVKKLPIESDCRNGEQFLKLTKMKFPDNGRLNRSLNLEECQAECLNNCSCRAYANLNATGKGSSCLMWFEELIDMKECTDGFSWGQDVFIRVAASELVDDSHRRRIIKIALVSTICSMLMFGLVLCHAWKKTGNRGKEEAQALVSEENKEEDIEVPIFDFVTIVAATNNFSKANMIGEGGFGPVYKGNLPKGQEIAVKRLSNKSKQGPQEFKNEAALIGKLQHRNLVALVGICIEREESMLIYEYMPNKSLDYFIFEKQRRKVLSWKMRSDIVIGIARGLLYLHQDSKLQIVHRDLKISNILLDSDLNPKISDFGLARIFRGDDKEANTKRAVGTFGYMSPEYATEGTFSLKSDIFSFGVLLLEIISGKKNKGFRHRDHHHNLIGHAWLLWNDGKALDLMDSCLQDSFIESQVQRYIQVGLLCVQNFPENRPEVSSVVFMLVNEEVALPQPGQPGFFTERVLSAENSRSENGMSITIQEGR